MRPIFLDPLHNYPVVRTNSPEEMLEALVRTYDVSAFEVLGPRSGFHARANHWQHGGLALSYCHYDTSVQVTFGGDDCARQMFRLQGSGMMVAKGTPVPITRHQSAVISPGEKFAADYRAGYRQLVLRIDTGTLMRSLGALLGEPAPHHAMFELSVNDDRPAAATLRRLVTFLAHELDAPQGQLPDVALAELSDAVVLGFVASSSCDFGRAIEHKPKAAAPWQVRRAEEYIKANWNQPITIESLAAVTSCPALALIRTFRQQRGCSPLAFAKRKRLQYARRMLAIADIETTSVAEVAYACGFHNEIRFADSYLRSFGELPSETLRYARVKRFN